MDDTRALVATASRVLGGCGHGDFIWGHASARDIEGRGFWVKSAGQGLGEVRAETVHLVDPGGTVLTGDGSTHSELAIHAEVYVARPDVGGVVHTHAPYAVALAASAQPLRPVSHAATLFVPPDVPRFDSTTDLILNAELGRQMAAALGSARALFLVNHGMVTVGADLRSATVAAVVLEQACRQQLLTVAFGGDTRWTSDEEALVKRGHVYSERAVAAVWDHLVRRLDAT